MAAKKKAKAKKAKAKKVFKTDFKVVILGRKINRSEQIQALLNDGYTLLDMPVSLYSMLGEYKVFTKDLEVTPVTA